MMTRSSRHLHVAILGGGLGGLLTANLLLKRLPSDRADTLQLTVFEASAHLGGRARSPRLKGGGEATLNLGPHAIYVGGALHRTLEELQLPISGAAPSPETMWLDISPASCPEPELMRLPGSLARILCHRHMNARQKARLLRVMRMILSRRVFEGDERSTSEWLDALCAQDAFVLSLVTSLTRLTTYCADLERLPARTASSQLRAALTSGVLYLEGGWETIVEALLERLAAHPHVTIETRSKVTSIKPLARGGLAIELACQEHRPLTASHVVAALPPRTLARLTGSTALQSDHLNPIHAACIDLLLEKNPARTHLSVHGVHKPFYYANHSAITSFNEDGAGAEVIHAAMYLRDDANPHTEEGIAQLERWLDGVAPFWREDIIASRRLPRIPVVQHLPFGETLPFLATPPDNLYAVGDWCESPPYHLADAVATSARKASDEICASYSDPSVHDWGMAALEAR